MTVQAGPPVQYSLPMGADSVAINPLIGGHLTLEWEGGISCIHCDRAIKKSFSQGYCYPCFSRLAQCDSCIVKPELCH